MLITDFIITRCIHVSNYHIVPHKYVQILCVNLKTLYMQQEAPTEF
jgi:hypothetical protein